MYKMFKKILRKRLNNTNQLVVQLVGFMNEFVDKDGNVFHKGKEQPKLKGTLPPTKVKAKEKLNEELKNEILVARHKEKLAAERQLKKDLDKQKKFLMGDIDK